MIKIFIVLMLLVTIGFAGVRFAFVDEIRKRFGIRIYLSVAVILAAGFVLHNALLFMLIAGGVMFVTASSRVDALCQLAILVALIPDVEQYITIGGLSLTSISTPVVLSFAALVACYIRKGRQRHHRFSAADALVLVLILCFGVGAARAGSFTGVQRTVVTIALQLGLPYFLYRRFVHDRADLALVVGTLAGSAMVLAFVAICESRLHWSIFDTIYMNQSTGDFLSRNMKMRAGFLRAPASFSDSTAYAILALVGIFAVISSRRFFRSNSLWWGSIALTILGMVAAQSRGADLGLLFGLFLMVVVRRRYALAAAVGGGGVAIVALLLVLATSSPTVAAFIGTDNRAGADQDYRQTLLRRGVQVGMEHPILGDDMSHVIAKMSDIRQGEGLVDMVNSYLIIFLSSGLVGLGLVGVLLFLIFRRLFEQRRENFKDPDFVGLQIFFAGALAADLFALTFTSFNYERNSYWFVMLLAGCHSLQGRGRGASKSAMHGVVNSADFSSSGLVHAQVSGAIAGPA